jgi:hypothetical protein
LQEKNSSLGGASPDKLAAFALAVLNVDVASSVFQAAVFKDTVDEDSVIKHKMLVLKSLAFKSVHRILMGHRFSPVNQLQVSKQGLAGSQRLPGQLSFGIDVRRQHSEYHIEWT